MGTHQELVLKEHGEEGLSKYNLVSYNTKTLRP